MRLISFQPATGSAPPIGAPGSVVGIRPRVGLLLGDFVIDIAAAAQALQVGDVPDEMLALIAEGERPLTIARDIERRAAELPAPTSPDRPAGNIEHPRTGLRATSPPTVALASVRITAPISWPRRNVVCVGLNYADHVAESKSVVGTKLPEYPVFFTKPATCVIGPDDAIPWHPHVSTSIDWEVELAVIIGREGRDITEEHALEHVFGYTVANDVTARDLQQRHAQWYKGKGLDGFCPLGPNIVTADEIGDPQRLEISLRVNGVEKQRSNTRFHIFSVARLIAEWSAGMTLLPGDILLTGTPSGVGVGRTPPEFLRPGDVVEAEVLGIGVLRNVVGGAE